ncbi:MAG: glycoside hydrolase family 2 [Clostridia bacterium]|nr:glycoside hydrolase family 2 [Clostridia bacterium]
MKYTKHDTMTTPYMERLEGSIPWTDYPRPSMVRDSYLSLNGKWDFATEAEGNAPDFNEKILVPFPPESLLSGIERSIPSGTVIYYRRSFTLPEGFVRDRVLLHFGAVDTLCCVYVNGAKAICHEGGYLPFYADITELLKQGENVVEVHVRDDLDKKYPYGKQKRDRGGMWYTPVSGIWQSVWLESVCTGRIEKILTTPTLHSVKVKVVGGNGSYRLTLDDGKVYEWSGDSTEIEIDEPKLWTPDSPTLYHYTLESGNDKVRSYFALRNVGTAVKDGIPRLTLNGEPYLFVGPLDQGYFPDGIFLPPTSEGYADDILNMKAMGFNMLRKHIKVEPEIFYYLCDKLGIAVFQDMVNNSGYSFLIDTALPTLGLKRLCDKHRHRNKESRRIFLEHARATVEHLYSFPSVVYYTIFNEGWGQFCADNAYEKFKAWDPTRIIDSTSGWFTAKKSDVDSRHVYFKKIKLGRRTEKPIVISEFGGYAYRMPCHVYGDRYYGYKLFQSEGELEDAVISLFADEIAPLIPLGISGLVYTQLSDVEDETNGLITYDRRHTKVNSERIAEVIMRLRRLI